MTRIIGWILGIVGGCMVALNIEYIKYSSYINYYNDLEEIVLGDYIEKGNMGIIGLIFVGIAVLLELIVKYINEGNNSETNEEQTPE